MYSFSLFNKRMICMYGAEGEQWVKSLPAMVEKYTKEWNLADLQAVDELSMNYVLRGSCEHEHIILKIGFEKESIAREALALRVFDGHGCVRLLKIDQINRKFNFQVL